MKGSLGYREGVVKGFVKGSRIERIETLLETCSLK